MPNASSSQPKQRRKGRLPAAKKKPATTASRSRWPTLEFAEAEADPVFDQLARLAAHVREAEPLGDLDDMPQLSEEARELVIDRLEAGLEDKTLKLTPDQYDAVLLCLVPEDFTMPTRPSPSTGSAPGTAARAATYAARVAAGAPVHSPQDSPLEGRKLRVAKKANGSGDKVLGWADEEPPKVKPGLYRLPNGAYMELC
jgi:hypothetical protein